MNNEPEEEEEEEFIYRTFLDGIRECGDGKWCHFVGKDSTTGEYFEETGKMWYLGDTIRKSGIDISHWDNGNFTDVVKEIIILKIEIGWNYLDGYNLFPDKITNENDIKILSRAINRMLIEDGVKDESENEDEDENKSYIPLTMEEKELRDNTIVMLNED